MTNEGRIFSLLVVGATLASAAQKPIQAPPANAVPAPVATFNFDLDVEGKPPSHFTIASLAAGAPLLWDVRHDAQAPSKPHVLVHHPRAAADGTVDLAILDGVVLDHGEVSVRFKALSSDENQSAGVVLRYVDAKAYDIVWANVRDDTCSLERIQKGKRKPLDEKQVIITPFLWHELRVVFVNDTYTVFIDGEPTMGGKYSGAHGQGQMGLAANPVSVLQFDDFRVSP